MNHKYLNVFGFGILALLCCPSTALGQLSSFAVLGGSTVTNTNTPTIVTGNLGVSPGSAVTGFPPGIVTGGIIHAADATAALQHPVAHEWNCIVPVNGLGALSAAVAGPEETLFERQAVDADQE